MGDFLRWIADGWARLKRWVGGDRRPDGRRTPDPVGVPGGGTPAPGGVHRRSASFTPPVPPEIAKILDPSLGLAWALIGTGDWSQLKSRFGIDQGSVDPQRFPLFLELGAPELSADALKSALGKFNLDVPEFYFKELASNAKLNLLTARLMLMAGNPSQVLPLAGGDPVPLGEQLLEILKSGLIRRISIARSHQPCLEESVRDIGVLPTRTHKGHALRGQGVVVGIIDDGCAFAHPHFLRTVPTSVGLARMTRVRHLWDQSAAPTATDVARGWSKVALASGASYGREINHVKIDKAIATRVGADGRLREDSVYKHLNYQVGTPGALASHGTHVMDIAAGNGRSPMGDEGVAPDADIVFVQLPAIDIQNPGPVLDQHIVDGVAYIFDKAGNRPAVVNISFGGYSGPHDGTSPWESAIDALLNPPNRVVVVSAGNGFEAECHASDRLLAGQSRTLGWFVKPEDPTVNDLELWYDGAAALTVELTEPGTGTVYGPFALGANADLQQASDNRIVGHVAHSQPGGPGTDATVLAALRPTSQDFADTDHAPARAGVWTVTVSNTSAVPLTFHAWIQRDDLGTYGGRRQQSRFVKGDSNPRCTIGDFATGQHTIAVGAYHVHARDLARYTACGPTRASSTVAARPKPDAYAPASEDGARQGVLSASSLRAIPTRMGGTSAAAPHVAGLVALILEYSTKYGTKVITADAIRAGLTPVAPALRFNRHQLVDANVVIKQANVLPDQVNNGRVDFAATMGTLFP